MTAGEDQPQPIIRDLLFGQLVRGGLQAVIDEQRQRARQRGVAAQPVKRAASGGRGQPRGRILGDAALAPGSQSLRVGVLNALLGQVKVAGHAHRRGEHERPLATVRAGDRGTDCRVA